jgi:hypothetical protein
MGYGTYMHNMAKAIRIRWKVKMLAMPRAKQRRMQSTPVL